MPPPHECTSYGTWELLIVLRAPTYPHNNWITYNNFKIGDKAKGYNIYLGSRGEIAGLFEDTSKRVDLDNSNHHSFSTFDHENDSWSSVCADKDKGAWWLKACRNMCLTCKTIFNGSATELGTHITDVFMGMRRV